MKRRKDRKMKGWKYENIKRLKNEKIKIKKMKKLNKKMKINENIRYDWVLTREKNN